MEIIEVDQEEGYNRTEAPNYLSSGGLGPCISVGAIYKNLGFLTHSVPGTIDLDGSLDQLIQDLKKEVKNIDDLSIYIAGGGLEHHEDKDYNEEITDAREIVLNRIKESGYYNSVKNVQWCNFDSMQILTLNLVEGIGIIEQEVIEGYYSEEDFQ